MRILTDRLGKTAVVRIDGPIDLSSHADLRAYMESTLEDGSVNIVLDLGLVSSIDSSGIGLLLNWSVAVQNQGNDFRMFSIPATLKKLRIDHRIATYATEAEALRHHESM